MPTPTAGPAKLYVTKRTDTPYQVVYPDPTQREKSGRAKRVPKWFKLKEEAEAYQTEKNKQLAIEGAAGVHMDGPLRNDATAAKQHLIATGHTRVTLLQLAQRYASEVAATDGARREIAPEVEAFLQEREFVDEAPIETIKNLKTRIWLWIDLAHITCIGDITRQSMEVLRTRPVKPQTRKNDLNAVSAFCTWLVSASPPKLNYH